MAKKKSKAQLKRLQKRAEARGERYEEKQPQEEQGEEQEQHQPGAVPGVADDGGGKSSSSSSAPNTTGKDNSNRTLRQIAMELKRSLESIAKDDTLKSKERRSAKRKAEAIAMEKAGEAGAGGNTCSSAEELLAWLEKDEENATTDAISQQPHDGNNNNNSSSNKKRKKSNPHDGDVNSTKKKRTNPYIVFVGQLSYDTTKDSLLAHFQKELGKETNEAGQPFDISEETLQVRLLTDPKTKKSRGMAFVEVVHDDPELLYACLKLHQTFLEGRRINVERSAGGKRNSSSRQSKIQQHRQEQDEYMKSVIQTMLQEHYDNGSIQKGELDDGVVALCCRHAATIVEAALERYCESHGRDMDNPSAYLAFLLSKLAEEGVFEKDNNVVDTNKKNSGNNRKKGRSSNSRNNKEVISGSPFLKEQKYNSTSLSNNNANKNHPLSSEFAKQGIDMSISDNNNGKTDAGASTADLSSIFPSYSSRGGRKG